MDLREKLISEVKKRPILYDKTRDDYKRYDRKEHAWAQIGQVLGLAASDAQSKWKNIRDALNKHYRKTDRKTNFTKPYKYASLLGFLIPHLGPPRTAGNSNDDVAHIKEEEEENFEIESDFSPTETETEGNGSTDDTKDGVSEEEESRNGIYTGATLSEPLPSSSRSPRSKRKRCVSPESVDISMAENLKMKKHEDDDISRFLDSMASSIRKLPAKAQAQVRFGIHKLVHEAELEYLFPRINP